MGAVALFFVLAGALFIAEHLGPNATLCLVVVILAGALGRRLRVRGG